MEPGPQVPGEGVSTHATIDFDGTLEVADAVSRYGLYAGASVVVAVAMFASAPRLISRIRAGGCKR